MAEAESAKNEQAVSIDPATTELLAVAAAEGHTTAFSRAEAMKPCPIGRAGSCCYVCYMGPCRMVGKSYDTMTGICGATPQTISARNLARASSAGASAHSDHGRDVVFTVLAVARGEAPGYELKDLDKLMRVAKYMSIDTTGKTKEKVAEECALEALANWGRQTGELTYLSRAPKKRQEIWRKKGIAPRGIDREIVETLHRTTIGTDQDPKSLLMNALKVSLVDGWGGAMLATDFTDILFGTPKPIHSRSSLGVLREDEVNVVVHGHEPTLSNMVVDACMDPELIEYAKSKGAKGINIAGLCCTANEILMRRGIPSAGSFLEQELAILTGTVDAMVVDVQCIMEALQGLSEKLHTKLITTSAKARIAGATHMQFDEHHAWDVAKQIVRVAIDNYPNRKRVKLPTKSNVGNMVAGFSHEYVEYMQGGRFRGSFRPLNDAIMDGRIMGVAGVIGCTNPRVTEDFGHNYVVEEFIKNDILVVQTGCGAIASAKYGLLTPEAIEHAGPGLREVCEAVGIPPVLHLGSCVDNSRILTIMTAMVEEGGLGDDISDLPVVGLAPEWMSEKAVCIACYFVASGAYVICGVDSPVGDSKIVTGLIDQFWTDEVGGKLHFITDPKMMVEKTIEHIKAKRKALKIKEYERGKFQKERVLLDMAGRRALEAGQGGAQQPHKLF